MPKRGGKCDDRSVHESSHKGRQQNIKIQYTEMLNPGDMPHSNAVRVRVGSVFFNEPKELDLLVQVCHAITLQCRLIAGNI